MAGPNVRVGSSSSSRSRTARRRGSASSGSSSKEMREDKGKGKQRASSSTSNDDDNEYEGSDDDNQVVQLLGTNSPSASRSILVVPPALPASSSDEGDGDADDLDAFDSTSRRDDGLLAPLLRFLPVKGRAVGGISGLRKLLGAAGVHPSALGSFRSKEEWRRDNPDVLYSAYKSRQMSDHDQCSAHSPPPPPSAMAADDLFDEELDWDKETETEISSDTDSVSSLAELGMGQQTPRERDHPQSQATTPSKLAIYLSKPPEEQRKLVSDVGRSSTDSPAASGQQRSDSRSSFSVSGGASSSRRAAPPSSPTQLAPVPSSSSRLRRQPSTSSLATSSSVCTCASRSSSVASISFAALSDSASEDLRSHRTKVSGSGRAAARRSASMGVAGRRNLLLGKTRWEEEDEKAFDDDRQDDEMVIPEEQEEAEEEEEEDDEQRWRRSRNESNFKVNEAGELVEKRPLGVTLEDLNLPMKRTKHTRGRPRNAGTDLSSAFSPPSSSIALPASGAPGAGGRSISSPPVLPARALASLEHGSNGAVSSKLHEVVEQQQEQSAELPAVEASDVLGHVERAASSSAGSEEKTPCATPRFEKLELAFTSSSIPSKEGEGVTSPSSGSGSEITPSATPRCGSPARLRMSSISPSAAVAVSVESPATVFPAALPDQALPSPTPLTSAPAAVALTAEEDTSPELVHDDLASSPSPSWSSSPDSPSLSPSEADADAYSSAEESDSKQGPVQMRMLRKKPVAAVAGAGKRKPHTVPLVKAKARVRPRAGSAASATK